MLLMAPSRLVGPRTWPIWRHLGRVGPDRPVAPSEAELARTGPVAPSWLSWPAPSPAGAAHRATCSEQYFFRWNASSKASPAAAAACAACAVEQTKQNRVVRSVAHQRKQELAIGATSASCSDGVDHLLAEGRCRQG